MALDGLMGQGRVLRILGGMLKTGRIVSTYLFCGPPGVGKETAAFSFIKAMNCEDAASAKEGNSCGRCRSCKSIDSLSHPDLRVIAPEDRMIKILGIREASEFLSTTTMQWKRKAVIIKDAHTMNPSAGNAFLKTLEEPPEGSIIVLITHKEEAILQTIRSRCIKIPFVPLSIKVLRTIAERRGIALADEWLALANGSAEAMLDDSLTAGRDRALEVFMGLAEGRKAQQWKDREEMAVWFESAMGFLRDMMVVKLGQGGTPVPLLNPDKAAEFASLCRAMDVEAITGCYETLFDLSRYFVLNINKGIVFNYIALKLREAFGRQMISERGQALNIKGVY
ncbi:MAG: DNA polymerase III subunit delta' [Nitrospirae bacterium]|nr:DNA polymerase III subunit delta' [Nitrospirota bacterium]